MGFFARMMFLFCLMGATPMVAGAMTLKEYEQLPARERLLIGAQYCWSSLGDSSCSQEELAPLKMVREDSAGVGFVDEPPLTQSLSASNPTHQASLATTTPDLAEANRTTWWVSAEVRLIPPQADTDREASKAVAACEGGTVEVYGIASETPEAAVLNPTYASNRQQAGVQAVRKAGGKPITDVPLLTGVGAPPGRGIFFKCANGRKKSAVAAAPGPAGPQGPAGAQGERGQKGETGASGGGEFSLEVGLYGRPSRDILDAGGGQLTLRWETIGDTIVSLQGGVGASGWGYNGLASLSVSWEVFDLLEIGPAFQLWDDVGRDFVTKYEYQAALGATLGLRFGGLRLGGFVGYGPNADRVDRKTDDQLTVTLTAGWVFGEEEPKKSPEAPASGSTSAPIGL